MKRTAKWKASVLLVVVGHIWITNDVFVTNNQYSSPTQQFIGNSEL
jgi:hypothetical protein